MLYMLDPMGRQCTSLPPYQRNEMPILQKAKRRLQLHMELIRISLFFVDQDTSLMNCTRKSKESVQSQQTGM